MIGAVLLIMVGNTTHILQVVGWLPLHPIRWLNLPYWAGLWFGLFATWEGVSLQLAAAAFVIGSYVLAEQLQHRRVRAAVARPAGQTIEEAGAETQADGAQPAGTIRREGRLSAQRRRT
jgi:high-affinity iron transporter